MANQEAIAREPSWRGSNRIAALDIESEPPNHVLSDKEYELEDPNHQVSGFRKFLSFVGPGFLVSLAYLDPGNLETDLQAGSNDKYELLWVILVGLLFALIIQSLAANLGVATGKHLAEICRSEYPKYVKYCLWILAELSVIAADIPEVIGTAFALNLLFHIPIWAGVLITGSSTLLLLGLQRYGIRKLELLISTLVFLLAACFFTELAYVKPKASDIFEGMFVPKLKGNSATGDAVALFGALIMPHNLFLHSALVLSRKVPQSVHGINSACKFFLWEAGFALFVAFWINVAMISVTASVCNTDNLSQANQDRCNNLTLDNASFLLKNSLGKASSIVYGISLLASGQSSAITGTYAGQFIMQGFLDLKMKKWLRNLVTRTIAITPSLVVSIIGGSAASGKLIIIASMILSFELPFALIPLLKFSSGHTKMGPHSNSIYIIIIAWLLGLLLVGINVYYLSTGFVGWLIHSSLPKAANVLIGLLVFPMMAIYIVSVLYLTFRKDTVVTFKEPSAEGSIDGAKMEKGLGDKNDHAGTDMEDEIPYREDLAHMAFPE